MCIYTFGIFESQKCNKLLASEPIIFELIYPDTSVLLIELNGSFWTLELKYRNTPFNSHVSALLLGNNFWAFVLLDFGRISIEIR